MMRWSVPVTVKPVASASGCPNYAAMSCFTNTEEEIGAGRISALSPTTLIYGGTPLNLLPINHRPYKSSVCVQRGGRVNVQYRASEQQIQRSSMRCLMMLDLSMREPLKEKIKSRGRFSRLKGRAHNDAKR